jgi:hypothetical protein
MQLISSCGYLVGAMGTFEDAIGGDLANIHPDTMTVEAANLGCRGY